MDAGLSPEQVASLRICGAAVLLLIGTALFRRRALRIPRREWPRLVAYGVASVALVQLCYFVAVSRLPIGVAMLLEYLSPVLVTLWVRFVRRVHLPRTVWFGVVIAVTGLAMVAQVWQGLSLDAIGVLAGLATAASAATYFLLGERGVAASDPVGVTTWGLVIGSVVVLPIDPPWTAPVRVLTAPTTFGPLWVLLLALVLVATIVAYLAGMASLRHLPPAVVSVVSLVEPVVATTLAWIVLGQSLSPVQVIGGAVLLTGAVVVQMTRSATPESPAIRESPSARSWAGDGTSPPPSDRPPAAPPARSGGYP